ncbi:hypothetical protein [Saccharopolyspora sp. NPDC050642]|uniref:hypothetical protein n=1 Tax=Saccharopolyspora sp. NPDC050642 TaxID=3157099 RepID=UPI0033D64BDE
MSNTLKIAHSGMVSAGGMPRGGNLLRHRDFRRLWVAHSISELGTRVNHIVLPLLAVTELDATAFQVSC